MATPWTSCARSTIGSGPASPPFALKTTSIQSAAVFTRAFDENWFPLKSTAAKFERRKQLRFSQSSWSSPEPKPSSPVGDRKKRWNGLKLMQTRAPTQSWSIRNRKSLTSWRPYTNCGPGASLWSWSQPFLIRPRRRKWKKPGQRSSSMPTNRYGRPFVQWRMRWISSKRTRAPGLRTTESSRYPKCTTLSVSRKWNKTKNSSFRWEANESPRLSPPPDSKNSSCRWSRINPSVCSTLKGKPSSTARSAHSTNATSKKLLWFAGTKKRRSRSPISATTTTIVTRKPARSFRSSVRKMS